jgi:hypothetical protein
VVATGTPEQVAANPMSYTGGFLSRMLEPAPMAARANGGRRVRRPRAAAALK